MSSKPTLHKLDPRRFDSIVELLEANGFTYYQSQDTFTRDNPMTGDTVRIPASELAKHTPSTFHEKAVRNGWFSPLTTCTVEPPAHPKPNLIDMLLEEDQCFDDSFDWWTT